MPPELTPRDGAKIPPKTPVPPIDPAVMAEIESMSKAEANALNAMAKASMETAEMCAIMVELLGDIKDILVKVCGSTGMPLPKHIADDIEEKVYNPDEVAEDDDDETPV